MTDQSVLRVDSVDVHVQVSSRPDVVVVARGFTTTTGWSHGHLELREPEAPPHDGVYEFDFVATPPVGKAGEMVTPIAGAGVIPHPHRNMRSVRVYAKTNSKEQPITTRQVRSLEGPVFAFDGDNGLGWRAVPCAFRST